MPSDSQIAIICITFLQALALHEGIDGQVLSITVAILAGLAGYQTGIKKERKRHLTVSQS